MATAAIDEHSIYRPMTAAQIIQQEAASRQRWKKLQYAALYNWQDHVSRLLLDNLYLKEKYPVTMTVDARLSMECLAQMKAEGGKRTVWKKLDFCDGKYTEREGLCSPYQPDFWWEPGWVEARGDQETHAKHLITHQGQTIDGAAIHVYFTKPKTVERGWCEVLVPLMVHMDDFIGAGAQMDGIVATFRRVYLTHADCELAVKYALERRDQATEEERKSVLYTSPKLLQQFTQMVLNAQRDQALSALHQQGIRPDSVQIDWTRDALVPASPMPPQPQPATAQTPASKVASGGFMRRLLGG